MSKPVQFVQNMQQENKPYKPIFPENKIATGIAIGGYGIGMGSLFLLGSSVESTHKFAKKAFKGSLVVVPLAYGAALAASHYISKVNSPEEKK